MAEMSIITQPLKTIIAAKGKMTQKAICGKDADMGGLLLSRVLHGSVCVRAGLLRPDIVEILLRLEKVLSCSAG